MCAQKSESLTKRKKKVHKPAEKEKLVTKNGKCLHKITFMGVWKVISPLSIKVNKKRKSLLPQIHFHGSVMKTMCVCWWGLLYCVFVLFYFVFSTSLLICTCLCWFFVRYVCSFFHQLTSTISTLLTGFYMITASVMKELNKFFSSYCRTELTIFHTKLFFGVYVTFR